VAVRVRIDAQRLLRIVAPVVTKRAAKCDHSLVTSVELVDVVDNQVEMQLLWHRCIRPCGRRQLVYLLNGQQPRAIRPAKIEPLATRTVVNTRWRWFMTGAIDET